MKGPTTIFALVAALTATLLTIPSLAEARVHRHWHRYGDQALYYDYSYGNVQSPWTYIYPAANWGPFFSSGAPLRSGSPPLPTGHLLVE